MLHSIRIIFDCIYSIIEARYSSRTRHYSLPGYPLNRRFNHTWQGYQNRESANELSMLCSIYVQYGIGVMWGSGYTECQHYNQHNEPSVENKERFPIYISKQLCVSGGIGVKWHFWYIAPEVSWMYVFPLSQNQLKPSHYFTLGISVSPSLY